MITKFLQYIKESRMKIDIPVPKDIHDIKNEFDKAGKKLYVVGGAVRDFLTGKIPHDYDLVTDALPEESKKILKNFNVSDEQGKNFGVLRIYTEDEPQGHELATFRKDISKGRDTKGSDQKVEIGKNITIEDDVKRRDLTQNALFYDITSGEIVDLVGGMNDIKNNKITAVGDPSQRFNEDRLRILRTFRFASRNLSKIDPKTSLAIKNDNRLRGISNIDDVSQERIIDEFFKTIEWAKQHNKLNSVTYYLNYLEEYDLLSEMFPGLEIDTSSSQSFDISVILANLFVNNNQNYNKLHKKMQEFKIPNKNPKYIDEVIFLLKMFDILLDLTELDKVPSLYKEKKRIKISDNTIKEFANSWNMDKKLVNTLLIFNPKIDGRELIKQGYKGSEIGKEIKRREIEEFKTLLDTNQQSKKYNL